MPDETNAPSERGQRRSGRSESEESSGGGKVIAIILVLLLAGAGFALYKRNASANERADADAKSIATLSNQVAEVQTRLMLANSDSAIARSNSVSALERRTVELMTMSNRFVQASLLLSNTQHDLSMTKNESANCGSSLNTVQAESDELRRQVATIPGIQRQLTELSARVDQGRFALASAQEALGKAQLEKAELERNLNDPAFLRLQTIRAEEAVGLLKRTAFRPQAKTSDKRARLELQADGTVRPVIAGVGAPKADSGQ